MNNIQNLTPSSETRNVGDVADILHGKRKRPEFFHVFDSSDTISDDLDSDHEPLQRKKKCCPAAVVVKTESVAPVNTEPVEPAADFMLLSSFPAPVPVVDTKNRYEQFRQLLIARTSLNKKRAIVMVEHAQSLKVRGMTPNEIHMAMQTTFDDDESRFYSNTIKFDRGLTTIRKAIIKHVADHKYDSNVFDLFAKLDTTKQGFRLRGALKHEVDWTHTKIRSAFMQQMNPMAVPKSAFRPHQIATMTEAELALAKALRKLRGGVLHIATNAELAMFILTCKTIPSLITNPKGHKAFKDMLTLKANIRVAEKALKFPERLMTQRLKAIHEASDPHPRWARSCIFCCPPVQMEPAVLPVHTDSRQLHVLQHVEAELRLQKIFRRWHKATTTTTTTLSSSPSSSSSLAAKFSTYVADNIDFFRDLIKLHKHYRCLWHGVYHAGDEYSYALRERLPLSPSDYAEAAQTFDGHWASLRRKYFLK